MTVRKRITIAALTVLGIFLVALALLGLCDAYRNHIARDCGTDCNRSQSEGTGHRPLAPAPLPNANPPPDRVER